MCGRYAQTKSSKSLAKLLDADDRTEGKIDKPDFNVAPTKTVPVAVMLEGRRELHAVRWGLVPSWAKDLRIGSRMINARFETVTGKPAFRAAFKRRRCLIPADGYYEWQPIDGRKQPYYLARTDGTAFVMAGLWEIWRDAEGVPWWTCTVITTDAPDDLGHIHDRTPMTLRPDRWQAWLDPSTPDPLQLLTPAVSGAISALAVTDKVNNVRNNGPELLTPA
ncbi:MAG TPA: SOS response-associated peptidase [Mycobacteriales bacterium]|nr:SOS response-associated peptidase [Mycobacteriales bacterium]